jgi:hypothetical protein
LEKLDECAEGAEMASDITGSGTNMDVMASVAPASVNVSMLAQSAPNMATTSPAAADSTSSMSSECMRTSRGTRSFLPDVWLKTVSPRFSSPEYRRRYVSCPKRVSSSLKARATSGPSAAQGSTTSVSPPEEVSRARFSTSVGEGRYETTPSSSGCTPLFCGGGGGAGRWVGGGGVGGGGVGGVGGEGEVRGGERGRRGVRRRRRRREWRGALVRGTRRRGCGGAGRRDPKGEDQRRSSC